MSAGPVVYGNLNFKVTEEEKWAFKELCARHRLSQVDALRRAIALLERELENRGRDASKNEGPE